MNIPKKIINKNLYEQVREEIKKKYPKHSAYRSMLIIDEYKKRGGILNKEYESKSDLKRWINEKWINMNQYLKGNIVNCGDQKYIKKSACRPLKRVNKKTPLTAEEVLKKHNKKDIQKAINKKSLDPQNKIIYWDSLEVKNKRKK